MGAAPARRLTYRVRRGFPQLLLNLGSPASSPKPHGRSPGSPRQPRRPRYPPSSAQKGRLASKHQRQTPPPVHGRPPHHARRVKSQATTPAWEIVLNAHDHDYNPSRPPTPLTGKVDHARSIRELAVGAGGTSLRDAAQSSRTPTSEVVMPTPTAGCCSLSIPSLPLAVRAGVVCCVADAGSGSCH